MRMTWAIHNKILNKKRRVIKTFDYVVFLIGTFQRISNKYSALNRTEYYDKCYELANIFFKENYDHPEKQLEECVASFINKNVMGGKTNEVYQ